MPVVRRREQPFSVRLSATDITLIDRAAALCGRSRTNFMREAAVRAAEEVLLEITPLRMSEAGFAFFLGAVSAPARPAPEMVQLFSRQSPSEARQ